MLSVSLFITIVELLHKDIYYFHIHFGEMMITMDDVSSMFYLPLPGSFFTTYLISQQITCIIAIRNLGVTEDEVLEEFKFNKGAHFCLSWL